MRQRVLGESPLFINQGVEGNLMSGTRFRKTEKAKTIAMSDQLIRPHSIGRILKRDPKTIRAFLQSDEVNKPELKELAAKIKGIELDDLYLIGYKARQNIHRRFDEGFPTVIESVATMDRSFQQRRLLEDKSNFNFSIVDEVRRIETNLAELRARQEVLLELEEENK